MNVSASDRYTVESAARLYGVEHWGGGYLRIGDDGHLLVTPQCDPRRTIDVAAVLEEIVARGIGTPVALRFPQLLEAQLDRLCSAFASAVAEFGYEEGYSPVFPIKVNQQRAVVDALLRSGERRGLGLEVGSRPELLAAALLPTPPDALILCNGFKDNDYLQLASLATTLGKRVVVVVEKPFEVTQLLELAAAGAEMPLVGFRIKLQSRGSGLWEKSGGFASKFGLTTLQLLRGLEALRAAGLEDRVTLLHFHIGSQVTEIRKIKNAVREAARVYAKLRRMGARIRYLDVGGGLGIDYDGSRTSSDASVNYSVQEYANDVVFGVQEVCEQEQVPVPHLVSESGRMLTAYHALLITDVRGVISTRVAEPLELDGSEPQLVQDMAEVARTISVKNYREFYHDALAYRDQLHSLFGLGMLDLVDRAKGETLFWQTASAAVRHSKSARVVGDEFLDLERKLQDKYICNFSVFQSLPDHWALDQLFPVIPVHRLDEAPTRRATLVDITCDSDGEVDKFVDLKTLKKALEVHELREGEPYYLAFALTGAYQDTMGDMHNLFGRVHEASVVLDPGGQAVIQQVRRGDLASEALESFGHDTGELAARLADALERRVAAGELAREVAAGLMERYRDGLARYTYLG